VEYLPFYFLLTLELWASRKQKRLAGFFENKDQPEKLDT
jgi:hypothetical protein